MPNTEQSYPWMRPEDSVPYVAPPELFHGASPSPFRSSTAPVHHAWVSNAIIMEGVNPPNNSTTGTTNSIDSPVLPATEDTFHRLPEPKVLEPIIATTTDDDDIQLLSSPKENGSVRIQTVISPTDPSRIDEIQNEEEESHLVPREPRTLDVSFDSAFSMAGRTVLLGHPGVDMSMAVSAIDDEKEYDSTMMVEDGSKAIGIAEEVTVSENTDDAQAITTAAETLTLEESTTPVILESPIEEPTQVAHLDNSNTVETKKTIRNYTTFHVLVLLDMTSKDAVTVANLLHMFTLFGLNRIIYETVDVSNADNACKCEDLWALVGGDSKKKQQYPQFFLAKENEPLTYWGDWKRFSDMAEVPGRLRKEFRPTLYTH